MDLCIDLWMDGSVDGCIDGLRVGYNGLKHPYFMNTY